MEELVIAKWAIAISLLRYGEAKKPYILGTVEDILYDSHVCELVFKKGGTQECL